MEGLSESDVGMVEREELMVPPSGDGEPTLRVAHFLQPTLTSIEGPVFQLPSYFFSSLPHTFEPKNWPLKLEFHRCISPQEDWKIWVGKMSSLHESTWKKAATITLEDMIIFGYSVLGSSVLSPLETDELKRTEEKLSQTIRELGRTAWNKAQFSLWKKTFMGSGSEIEHEAFLAFWLSRFVLPTYSVIVKAIFPIATHLARGTRIALAPAVLAHIYRDFSLLKEKIVSLTQLDHFENEEDSSALAITLHSPLQLLVQIWAWERFLELRPKPNFIKLGEPRIAQWHKTMLRVENVRTVLDSAEESFDWHPYAKTLKILNFPKFYAEKEICVEHYFPHRVAMQFGLDQDLPDYVARVSDYSKPISFANFYVPPWLYEADFTTRYLEWWKDSLHHLQAAKEGVLPRERIFRSSKITRKKRSKTAKRVNHFIEGAGFSTSKMRKRKSEETSTEKKDDDSDASGSAGLLLSKTLPLSLIIKKELNESPFPPAGRQDDVGNEQLNDSPFPPGFRPKSNMVDARDTTKEDNLTTRRFSISSKRHDDVGNGQFGDGEYSSGHCQKFSSSKVVNEADKIVVPLTKLIEKQNELVERGLETVLEDAIGSETGSTSHDMERSQGVEGDGNEHETEIQELQIEDRVSRLERIFAELKAARFGHK
ncbi:hypothetical protein EZV62_008979 [Acer yangbiense]|uniref:Aminotransferase-like plant mobile domain-containing protein n=1 Tax=Acer yangbiense TaxID=1000413 RepID=A0A5C7IFD7_9ROSI|nr:hypothetical protein EZV62_008979 [Acer yangbiense]